jgi:hypothetical protein
MVKLFKPEERPVRGTAQISSVSASAAAQGRELEALGTEYMARAKASADSMELSTALTKATEELTAASRQRSEQLVGADGKPLYGTLSQDIESEGKRIRDKHLKQIVSFDVMQQFNNKFTNFLNNKVLSSRSTARSQQRSYTAAQLDQNLYTMSQQIASDPSMLGEHEATATKMINDQVASGAMSKLNGQRLLRSFVEKNRENVLRTSIDADPDAAIKELTSTDLTTLGINPDQHRRLLNDANIAKRAKIAAEEANLKKIEEQTKVAFTQAEELLSNGAKVPDQVYDYLGALAESSPEVQKQFDVLKIQEELSMDLTQRPEEERAEILEQMQNQGLVTEEQQETFELLKTLDENLSKLQEEDPITLLELQGTVPLQQPFDVNSDIIAQLEQRQDVSLTAKAKFNVITHGLKPDEVTDLGNYLNTLDPQSQAVQVANIKGALGTDSAADLLADLKIKGADTIAFAGMLALENQDLLSTELLESSALIKDKKISTPKESEFLEAMASAPLPQYFLTEQKKDIYDAARKIYSKRAFDAGVTELDTSLLDAVVRDLTNGGAMEYNGSLIEPPIKGMSEDEFYDFADAITEADVGPVVTKGGLNAVLKDANLQNVGRGRYLVHPNQVDETSVLLTPKGDLFVLDFNEVQANRKPRKRAENVSDLLNSPTLKEDFLNIWNPEQDTQGLTEPEQKLLDKLNSDQELSYRDRIQIRNIIYSDIEQYGRYIQQD